jgi:hypothetical protein
MRADIEAVQKPGRNAASMFDTIVVQTVAFKAAAPRAPA